MEGGNQANACLACQGDSRLEMARLDAKFVIKEIDCAGTTYRLVHGENLVLIERDRSAAFAD